MKVVYLADAPYPHTWRWVEHFARSGVECEVISFRPAEIAGARVHYIGGAEPFGKARYLIHARRVRQLIHDLAPDLVHAMHLTSYGFLGALAGFQPLIISVWGTDILEAPHLTPFHRWLTRYSLARARVVTATGLHLATETTRYMPQGAPVTVVPFGVDLERFRPRQSGNRAIGQSNSARPEALEGQGSVGEGAEGAEPHAPVIIGATSRFSTEKGVRYLIEAFALLRQRYGDRVKLRLAGEGPEQHNLEALARERGLVDAVEFAGWVDHAGLPAFLQGLDIFALPSVYEGFGVSAAEASAVGLPVVASNVHGIPDVVRDSVTGLLVPAKDPQALANALGRLVEDAALRRSLGEAGRSFIGRHYDWRQNVGQMEMIYRNLIAGRSAANEVPVWS